jgi:hypothetical protein
MGTEQRLDREQQHAARRRFHIFSRFYRDSDGSAVIEFGMLALPFLLLLFAILETCISFAAQQVLANAVDDISRQIRTGQIQGDDLKTDTKIRDFICGRLEIMVASDCPGLVIDLRHADTFDGLAEFKMPLKGTNRLDREIDDDLAKFEPGKNTQKNRLRVLYPWPIMTNLMQKSLSTLKDNKILLLATAIWQNEPFNQ